MGEAISSLLFQPPAATYLHPSRHFWLTTSTGSSIPAFFIERPNAQVTILFSHGNAEDLGMIYDWVCYYAAADVGFGLFRKI
jgi:abhydrolase domain-containing protein 17